MADEFPRAEVIGIDLAPIQPRYGITPCISSEPNNPLPAHPHVRTAGVDILTRPPRFFVVEWSHPIARTYLFFSSLPFAESSCSVRSTNSLIRLSRFELCDLDLPVPIPYPDNHFDFVHARSMHTGVRFMHIHSILLPN